MKLFWLTPCSAVENQGEQEEGFVKMKKDQVARRACVRSEQKERGNYKAVNLLIMNG